MQTFNLIHPGKHSVEHIVKAVFVDDLFRGVQQQERVGRYVVVDLQVR